MSAYYDIAYTITAKSSSQYICMQMSPHNSLQYNFAIWLLKYRHINNEIHSERDIRDEVVDGIIAFIDAAIAG